MRLPGRGKSGGAQVICLYLSTGQWVVILFTNNPPTPLQTEFINLLGTNSTLFYRLKAIRK